MKAYKVTLLIIDLDEIGADEVKEVIESARYANRCISPNVVQIESAEIGKWHDDHPLNNTGTSTAEWKRLFPSLSSWNP